MRIGVFGGTFDPPHNGHLAICNLAHNELRLDRLILSVSRNPFKSASATSDSDRLRMAELLAEAVDGVGGFASVTDWELSQPGPSYTIALLRYLRGQMPAAEFVLLVGEDSYRDMPQWKGGHEIAGLCRIAVFTRRHGSCSRNDAFPARFIDLDLPISATDVRSRVAAGAPVAGLVPPPIAAYIAEKGLYR